MCKRLLVLIPFVLMLVLLTNAQAQPTGTILIEYWNGLGGTNLENNFYNQPRYPDGADDYEILTLLDKPYQPEYGNNYAAQVRGYLYPPGTGDYTFWVAGDDDCDLFLSTDDDPANKVKIAEINGWCPAYDWDNTGGTDNPNQVSAPVSLVTGTKYYIEAAYKEGGGGDGIAVAWQGPGIPDRVIIDGAYLSPAALSLGLLQAGSPNPADGAIDVDISAIEWSAGAGAVSHRVYLSSDATIDDADLLGETPLTIQVAILDLGATYYWRVDEIDADGNVIEGNVWTFTTIPMEAHFPNPFDGAMWRGLSTKLSWAPGKDAIMHDMYFSTDEAAVAAADMSTFKGKLFATSFDPGALDPDTTYYWRVDEFSPTGTVAGPVWSFTTLNPDVGGVVAEYWTNMSLSGAPALITAESNVNFDFNAQRGSQPHPDVPVTDNFSCRWSAELQVPVTGTYVLYEASDDGSRMFLNGELVAEGWYDRGTTEDSTGPLELVAGERYLLVMEMYENGGGATAYLRWQGPGMPKEIIPQGALTPPQMAFSTSPKNGAVGLGPMPTLSWMAGDSAVLYDLYLSKNQALLAAGDASVLVGGQPETSYAVADALGRGTTWFWKVDVVTADGTVLPGLVSSFRIADENTDNWAVGVQSAGPTYLDTYVQDGLYDIGTYGGEQTYEFIVMSNPDETQASMALIGRRQFGDTQAGLKFDQWNNTGEYGATLFGVVDLYYGVANNPGEYVHLVFVSSQAASKTDLYVNGALAGSVDRAISLSGIVGIGYGAQGADMSGRFDDFDGDIFGVAIYDRALTADEIVANANEYFNPIAITDPDMLIYYDFESGAGSLAIDQSGHSNHGQFIGTPEWVPGLFGTAVSIVSGDVDYIQTTAPLNITSNNISVTGWVYHDQSPAAWSGILTTRGEGNLGLQHNGVELRYMWGSDEYWWVESGLNLPNGEWYFAALTISPDQGKLYLNGVDQTLTNVAPHRPVVFDSLIRVGRDHNNNRIQTSLIDEVRLYNRTLTDVEIQRMVLSDVTAPGDTVRGVPDDGDWPGAEHPALAIDDNVNTKYLHFKGETQPTGFQVEPAMGPTIVTGLTLTTANDATPRDPVSFELYGSNDSLDGPYELIAAGDVADFAQADAWPRFTMNATAISFANEVAYKYYQVMFPTVRNPGGADSMQIAEIELLGVAAFENLAANGGLEDDLTGAGWNTYGNASMEVVEELLGAAVPEGPVEGAHSLHVTVNAAGANFWDAGLQHGGKVFEAGKSYTLSVWFKSKAGPFQINIKPERGGSPWEGYGSQAVTITEEWAEYTVNTGVIAATVDPASLTFHIAYAPGEFWADNLVFYEDK